MRKTNAKRALKARREMFIVERMLYRIAKLVYRRIRKHAGYSKTELAEKLKRHRQTVWRWENNKAMPTRDQEDDLVAVTNLTEDTFVELLADAMIEFGGRKVVVDPESFFLPSPLVRATRLYDRYQAKLRPEARDRITDRLGSARQLDVMVLRAMHDTEKDVRRLIEEELAARGESLDDDLD